MVANGDYASTINRQYPSFKPTECFMRRGEFRASFRSHFVIFAQRNNLQQNEASTANADAANRSGATDAVGIISFHRDDRSQMVAGSDKLNHIYREI